MFTGRARRSARISEISLTVWRTEVPHHPTALNVHSEYNFRRVFHLRNGIEPGVTTRKKGSVSCVDC